jgi:hypothetical protein
MIQVFVDNVAHELDQSPETWGDLLTRLDERALDAGTILSETRFDGVEEPSFRDPVAVARPLDGINRVDVRTSPPSAFLRECLLEAIPALEDTAHKAASLATTFRGHDLAPGHEGMKSLAAELHSVAALTSLLSGPLAIDLTAIAIDGVTASQHLEQFESAIGAVVAAQETEDWLTVADVLEYDLEPSLRRWSALLTLLTSRLQ